MNSAIILCLLLAAVVCLKTVAQTCPSCSPKGSCNCPSHNNDWVLCTSCTGTGSPSAAPIVLGSVGQITTIAGSYGGHIGYAINNGPATSANFNNIQAIVTDVSGNVYICDEWNQIVRMVIQSSGIIVTVAGIQGESGTDGDRGALATSAKLNAPRGIAIDSSGNLYISDSSNNAIRKVTFGLAGPVIAGVGTGNISTVVGALGVWGTTMGAATSTRYHFTMSFQPTFAGFLSYITYELYTFLNYYPSFTIIVIQILYTIM